MMERVKEFHSIPYFTSVSAIPVAERMVIAATRPRVRCSPHGSKSQQAVGGKTNAQGSLQPV